jgi:hypothetical protein
LRSLAITTFRAVVFVAFDTVITLLCDEIADLDPRWRA